MRDARPSARRLHPARRRPRAGAGGGLAGARLEMPVKVLFGRGDLAQHPSQLAGLEERAPLADVEVVDGGHFLVDERPQLVAERARAWFA